MKNTNKVRLTESQLHSIIKESVKQLLSELDWKTAQNASIKSNEILRNNPLYKSIGELYPRTIERIEGEIETMRSNNIPKTKINKYMQKKYGVNSVSDFYRQLDAYKNEKERHNGFQHYANEKLFGDKYVNGKTSVLVGGKGGRYYRDNVIPTDDSFIEMDITPTRNNIVAQKGKFNGFDDEGYADWSNVTSLDPNSVMDDDEKRIHSELTNFANDNYEYEPNGRGWHLKDGVDECIRRAIRKVLH